MKRICYYISPTCNQNFLLFSQIIFIVTLFDSERTMNNKGDIALVKMLFDYKQHATYAPIETHKNLI